MHTLYQLNGFCFEAKLQAEGRHSRTVLKNNTWKYYWFLTEILQKQGATHYADGYVRFDAGAARKLLGNSKLRPSVKGQPGEPFHFVDLIRKDLKRWGIIKARYSKKRRTDGSEYWILLVKVLDEWQAGGWRTWQQGQKMASQATSSRLPGVYGNIERSLSLVTIEHDEALRHVQLAYNRRERLPAKRKSDRWRWKRYRYVDDFVSSSWRMSINNVHEGNWNVKVDATGRVYSSITNLPKRFRELLRLDGLPLVAADVSCSQPLLFGVYLKREYPTLTPDMEHYLQLVQSGEFYSYLKGLLVHHQLPFADDYFKGEFFGKIFYSKEKVFGKWRCLFHHYFPGVSEAIMRAKGAVFGARAGNPAQLSRELTTLESTIMIQGVARRLYEDGIDQFVTIHDAIFTTTEPGMLDVVVATIIEEYQRHGVTPHIKRE